jgi:hypothetical protein
MSLKFEPVRDEKTIIKDLLKFREKQRLYNDYITRKEEKLIEELTLVQNEEVNSNASEE